GTQGCLDSVGDTASAASTDQTGIAGPVDYSTASATYNGYQYNVPSCTVSENIFCVPVPFGPVKISVTNTFMTNFTWCYVKPGFYTASGALPAAQYCNPTPVDVGVT